MNVTNMYKYKKSCCYIYIDLLFFFTNEYVVDSELHRAMNLYNKLDRTSTNLVG